MVLQGDAGQNFERQGGKGGDPAAKFGIGLGKGKALFGIGPTALTGSGRPQCPVIDWPGQGGHSSFAAVSQTVNTKSIAGTPGA